MLQKGGGIMHPNDFKHDKECPYHPMNSSDDEYMKMDEDIARLLKHLLIKLLKSLERDCSDKPNSHQDAPKRCKCWNQQSCAQVEMWEHSTPCKCYSKKDDKEVWQQPEDVDMKKPHCPYKEMNQHSKPCKCHSQKSNKDLWKQKEDNVDMKTKCYPSKEKCSYEESYHCLEMESSSKPNNDFKSDQTWLRELLTLLEKISLLDFKRLRSEMESHTSNESSSSDSYHIQKPYQHCHCKQCNPCEESPHNDNQQNHDKSHKTKYYYGQIPLQGIRKKSRPFKKRLI